MARLHRRAGRNGLHETAVLRNEGRVVLRAPDRLGIEVLIPQAHAVPVLVRRNEWVLEVVRVPLGLVAAAEHSVRPTSGMHQVYGL